MTSTSRSISFSPPLRFSHMSISLLSSAGDGECSRPDDASLSFFLCKRFFLTHIFFLSLFSTQLQ